MSKSGQVRLSTRCRPGTKEAPVRFGNKHFGRKSFRAVRRPQHRAMECHSSWFHQQSGQKIPWRPSSNRLAGRCSKKYGAFLKWGYPQSSSILEGRSIINPLFLGDPMETPKVAASPNRPPREGHEVFPSLSHRCKSLETVKFQGSNGLHSRSHK